MKKEGIQTRNRKMTSKTRHRPPVSLSRHPDMTPSRRLFHLRTAASGAQFPFDTAPHYYHQHAATGVFSSSVHPAIPGLDPAHFYRPHTTGPQGYTGEYAEGCQMAEMGYGGVATTHDYHLPTAGARTVEQQYLSAAAAAAAAAAAGFHRHRHDLI